MSAYLLSVEADRDLDAIWEYIAADNMTAADRFLVKISMRSLPSRESPYRSPKK